MEVYVGMDVSLKETSICVVDGSGGIAHRPMPVVSYITEEQRPRSTRLGPIPELRHV